jgi:hypothetical protein
LMIAVKPIIAILFLQERPPGRDSRRGTALLQLNAGPHYRIQDRFF